ncbi:MAG: outer membrane beta-barrel domain-containing protein [Kofleriaceae bacterium]
MWGLAIAILALALGGGNARAQGPVATAGAAAGALSTSAPGTDAPAKPSDAPLPSCLDQTIAGELGETLKPRGVQKKIFRKRHKLNLVAHGGMYAGDLTSSSWIAGGSLGYFITEDFGFEAEFDLTPLTLDLDKPLTQFFGDDRFKAGMAYVALGNAMWAPIHAKLKLGGGIVHSDIILFGGGGRMIHDAVQGLSFDAGAAIDFFVSGFATIRLDTRDLMAIEEIAGDTRFTHNIIATAGLSLWIPFL